MHYPLQIRRIEECCLTSTREMLYLRWNEHTEEPVLEH